MDNFPCVFLLIALPAIAIFIAMRAGANKQARLRMMPGSYEVYGVDRNSKTDVRRTYTAASAENARAKAEVDGIAVTRVDRLGR